MRWPIKKVQKRINFWFPSLFTIFLLIILNPSFASATGEKYPDNPVNIIVPYPPGGMIDLQAKIIGDKMEKILGQPFIRIHKPGAGGTLGLSLAARAKPDGYTLVLTTNSGVVLSPIVKKLDYKLEDFIPIGIHARGNVFLGVKTDAKWKTLEEFLEDAKKAPGELKVASFGKLTTAEFVIEELNRNAGIKLNHVPYQGCPPAMTALLGGHVDGYFCTTSVGQLGGGNIRVLAVADYERSQILPDIRTFKEAGFDISMPIFYSLFISQKTPPKIVEKLSNSLQEIFKLFPQEIGERFKKLEVSASFYNSSDSIKKYQEDYGKTLRMAKELGILAK